MQIGKRKYTLQTYLTFNLSPKFPQSFYSFIAGFLRGEHPAGNAASVDQPSTVVYLKKLAVPRVYTLLSSVKKDLRCLGWERFGESLPVETDYPGKVDQFPDSVCHSPLRSQFQFGKSKKTFLELKS